MLVILWLYGSIAGNQSTTGSFRENIVVCPISMWLGDHANGGLFKLRLKLMYRRNFAQGHALRAPLFTCATLNQTSHFTWSFCLSVSAKNVYMKNVLGVIHFHISVRNPCQITQGTVFHGHAHRSRANRWPLYTKPCISVRLMYWYFLWVDCNVSAGIRYVGDIMAPHVDSEPSKNTLPINHTHCLSGAYSVSTIVWSDTDYNELTLYCWVVF